MIKATGMDSSGATRNDGEKANSMSWDKVTEFKLDESSAGSDGGFLYNRIKKYITTSMI